MTHRLIKKDDIFCLALSITLAILVLKDTTFELPKFFNYSAIGIAILLVMFKVAYFDVKTNIKSGILGIIFFIISAISCIKIGRGIGILLIPIFMIGAYQINFKKIVKTFLYTNTSIVVLVVTSFKSGFK